MDPGADQPKRWVPADFGIGRLFDIVREAIIIADAAEGSILLWNPAASTIFGYSPEEAVGMPLQSLIPERLRGAHLAGLARYHETGHGTLIDQHTILDLPAVKRDGQEIDIEMSLTPIEGSRSDGRYALAIIRDATERKRLSQAKEDFVAMVVHDLRSPMAVIKGLSATMLDQWAGLAEEQKLRCLDAMSRNVDTAINMISDVLRLAAIESAGFSYEIRPFAIGPLIESVSDDFLRAHPGRAIDLDISADLPAAEGDEAKTGQVLHNLLSNAVKFSPEESSVEVSAVATDEWVRVSVRDQGVGIATENLGMVFEKFGRVSEEGDPPAGGTGLGLYIAREMIEGQAGSMSLESERGQGATFSFQLPVAKTTGGQ
ncbi:MAG: hypothetical protein QOC87_1510 [Actinomycetota bacterium]|jgi:PAS domain S-box-containing protein|nr:hypothetical protein [Actinomycetota bacterium]